MLRQLANPSISARVSDIDEADAILVLGTDPLHSSPILDLRVRKAIRRNGAKLVVATERPTALDGGAEAIARYAPGQAAHFVSELASAIGGAENVATPVAETLREAGSVVVVWGERIAREEGAAEALLEGRRGNWAWRAPTAPACWKSPTPPTPAACARPAASPTPAPASARPPRACPPRRSAPHSISGELSGLILFGADPLRDFPDTPAWEEALTAADFVVSFSMHENATTAKADVVLPLETHAEKDGTVTHPDGRLQRVRPSASRPGDVLPNILVLSELAAQLGLATGIDSQPTAFEALTEAVTFYNGIDGRRHRRPRHPLAGHPICKQHPRAWKGARPWVAGALPAVCAAEPRGGRPHALTLGTYRDLWAGPVTELNPPLKFLTPHQRLEISPSRRRAPRPEDRRRGPRQPERRPRSTRRGPDQGADQPRASSSWPRASPKRNANALLNGGPVRSRSQIEEVGA